VSPAIRDAVASYRARLERELPGRVLRVTLFGSWARGEAHEDSDVDVLVVLSHATGAERARAIDAGGMTGLERGLVVAPLVLTEAEWNELVRHERRLAREIERDGVSA
jgi:predicted nucleotidyltransferase